MFARRPAALPASSNHPSDANGILNPMGELSTRFSHMCMAAKGSKTPASSVVPKDGYYLGREVIFANSTSRPNTPPSAYLVPNRHPSTKPPPLPPLSSKPAPLVSIRTKSGAPTRRKTEPLPQLALSSSDDMSPSKGHPGDQNVTNLHSTNVKRQAARRRSTAPVSSTIQCSGITRQRVQCQRQVASFAPISMHVDPLGDDGLVERYCFQHQAEIQAQTAFYSRRVGVGEVKFSDHISDELLPTTQVLLKIAMEKAVSDADPTGQIYCLRIIYEDTPAYVHFEIGYSDNITRRKREWTKKCGAHKVVLCATLPEKLQGLQRSRPGSDLEMMPHADRLVSLIHIELADRALRANNPGITADKIHKAKALDMSMYKAGKHCACGSAHRELLTFPLVNGDEFEQYVLPAWKTWAKFVVECI